MKNPVQVNELLKMDPMLNLLILEDKFAHEIHMARGPRVFFEHVHLFEGLVDLA